MNEDRTADAEELLVHLEAHLGPFNESRATLGGAEEDGDGLFSVLGFERGGGTAYATFGISSPGMSM